MVDERKKQDLYNAFENADTVLLKKYINNLDSLPLVQVNDTITNIKTGANACLYHIDKLVYDKEENIHDKLTTVYTSLFSNKKTALIMIIKGNKTHVDLYLGAVRKNVNEEGGTVPTALDNLGGTLSNVLKGNFAGTQLHRIDTEQRKDNAGNYISDSVESVIESCFNGASVIASVSGIAALRNQNENKSAAFIQGMEKLVDSMRGKEYAVIYIADVMSNNTIEALCSEYEDIYSQLSPFRQSVHTLNENNSRTDTTSLIEGVVNTTNESLSKAVSHGTSHSITKTNTWGGGANAGIEFKVLGTVARVGAHADYHHAKGEMDGTNAGVSDTTMEGKAKSLTTQNSIANALTTGTGESLQITYDNRAVRTLLDRIEEQIKRMRSCEDFGMFDSCVYFISNKYENAVSAASTYKSLIRGENSSVESSAVNVWTNENAKGISEYLKRFYHPMFQLQTGTNEDKDEFYYLPVTPALMVSGRELAFQFSLPKKSVSGLPVIECAEFGRNVISADDEYKGDLRLGRIYHMHHPIEESEVLLSSKDLTAHTFVTGTTGAGKSNAVYQMLAELMKNPKLTFMVVEPTKGEYKDVFGANEKIQVDVYGTNPKLTPLLRINPFRFPAETHVYEHMDRLVEIFNVCWPMYAAMPAVLKAALEQAYISAGWNLERSENRTGVNIYPTFATVAREVRKYMDSSEYSDENKGNYKGALLTRLESLTNGINGMIFTSDDLEDEELFDKNVIVDLSRIGSQETKALIMGVLIMRLQEYRVGTSAKNSRLRHITVLEEAHHLLKRTSTEQSCEGANLLGKSVEMLANSIAEMRTYGEAFVIVDQAPVLLDMSVIRNTNTKIILRLPDYTDRELVGKAANLKEEQIMELSKLKKGVAAVYQNDWLNPVLCQFDRYESDEKIYVKPDRHSFTDYAVPELLNVIMKSDFRKKLDDVDYEKKFIHVISVSRMPDFLKVRILEYLVAGDNKEKAKQLAEIAYHFFEAEKTLKEVSSAKDIEEWQSQMIEKLHPSIKGFEETEINTLLAMLVREHYLTHKGYEPFYLSYMDYIAGKSPFM